MHAAGEYLRRLVSRDPPKISNAQVHQTIREMESLAQDFKSSCYAEDYIFPRLAIVEDTLVRWLTELACWEVMEDIVPTRSEMESVQVIHKFYHAYVPLLRLYLAEYQLPEPCRVYIAHSGVDKDIYAEHIKIHLDEEAVPGVFLDKNMPLGGDATKQMLYRALTCSVFWFVSSRNIITSPWPLRELMIAYVRHQTEAPDKVCLLMDCFESESGAYDTWYQRLFGIQSLALFNHRGEKAAFPSNMQQMGSNEPHHHRVRRLARLPALSGQSIVDLAGKPLLHSTSADYTSRSRMWRTIPDSFRHRIAGAKDIKIVTTWFNLSLLETELVQALGNGASMHVWLLSPDSKISVYRRNALLDQSSIPVHPDPVKTGIKTTMQQIDYIQDVARRKFSSASTGKLHPVDVRFCDTLPAVPIIQVDDWFLHGFYLHNRTINPGPWVEVPSGDFFADVLRREMEVMDSISQLST